LLLHLLPSLSFIMPSTYIRPTIRKPSGKNSKTIAASSSSSPPVQELEQKMGSWMGLGSSPSSQPEEAAEAPKKPTSILKAPKYPSATSVSAPQHITEQTKPYGGDETKITSTSGTEAQPEPTKGPYTSAVVCEQFVVERDPYQPIRKNRQKQNKQVSHSAVEGYEIASTTLDPTQPKSGAPNDEKPSDLDQQTNKNSETDSAQNSEDDPMMILSSVEELFEAAGEELPKDRTTITPDTKLVEADMAFSVMTEEEYGENVTEMRRESEAEREDVYKMFMGNENIFDDDISQAGSDDDSEGEEEFLNFMMEQEMNGEEEDQEEVEEAQLRAFSLIWSAFLEWLTAEAVEWMARLEGTAENADKPLYSNDWSPQVDRSDIGASRCAGLMAMIKMYLPSSMEALNHPEDMRRTAEHRIGDFLRTFDYSSEAPKLPTKMWKAVTCILLDMVLLETRPKSVESVPPTVEAVGITIDEYRYLTRSAVQTFQH
jgi:hypothetical protein